ncbi:MAG: PadR family transcriptional regulator, partial [Chloroflexi bacterium]|nr:PadR family transcriptional regulator [Chloroflexota bacterium]
MSIKYAILGFLSWKSLTGYELKKLFTGSETLYWSGNNNQIYTTLAQLYREKLVTKEVQHQESSPSRKVYTITDTGLAALKQWLAAAPELPQLKNSFLIQLMWEDQLEPDELNALLDNYEEELRVRLLMVQEQERRRKASPAATPRTAYLWDMIGKNWISFYEHELN